MLTSMRPRLKELNDIPYIKAFRWASDRVKSNKDGGVIAFVTNSGWIDKMTFEGFRQSISEEFTDIYVFNLRGAIRGKSGETAKKEGQNVFDIMTGVAVTILIYNPNKEKTKACIHYKDIGNYLSRQEKLLTIEKFKSINIIDWTDIAPNDKNDWIDLRDGTFDNLILIGDKDNKQNKNTFFAPYYSNGLKTQRDGWCYNSSIFTNKDTIDKSTKFFLDQEKKYLTMR